MKLKRPYLIGGAVGAAIFCLFVVCLGQDDTQGWVMIHETPCTKCEFMAARGEALPPYGCPWKGVYHTDPDCPILGRLGIDGHRVHRADCTLERRDGKLVLLAEGKVYEKFVKCDCQKMAEIERVKLREIRERFGQ